MKTLWKSIDQKKTEKIIIAVLVVLIFTVFCCKDVAITMRDKALAYSEEVRVEEQEKMEGEITELKVHLQQEISFSLFNFSDFWLCVPYGSRGSVWAYPVSFFDRSLLRRFPCRKASCNPCTCSAAREGWEEAMHY